MASTSQPPQHPQSLTAIFLDQPPSCLQFCPTAPDYLVIGTYLLSETKSQGEDGNVVVEQNKTGSLQLWKLDSIEHKLSLIQKLPLPYAVFDLHFHPTDPSILAIATSAGSVALFSVSTSTSESSPVITHLWTRSVYEDPSIPALFLSWAPRDGFFKDPRTDGFAITFSDGRTTLFASARGNLTEEKNISELGVYDATQAIEMWFVALAAFPETKESTSSIPFMFTGDDFGTLYTRRFEGFNTSSSSNHAMNAEKGKEEEEEHTQLQPLQDYSDRARHHTAGITSILPLPIPLEDSNNAPLLLTGSYDEYLRVYHATRPGKVLAEICLGGGVWRLQLLNIDRDNGPDSDSDSNSSKGQPGWKFLVLASCMHAGTRLVKTTWLDDEEAEDGQGKWEIEVLAEFTEHESMNYASDVWKGDGGSRRDLLCVSSSFYDRRICVWRVDV